MKYLVYALLAVTSVPMSARAAKTPIPNKKDGQFVSISGKVKNVTADSFRLSVDGKSILVEMDDYDHKAEGYNLRNGDQVVVSGRVDQDFGEKKKIEASSVYVKNLKKYFFANSADEEDYPYWWSGYMDLSTFPAYASMSVRGKVTSINGREFTVDTGFGSVKVDTSMLGYNPLDNLGYTQIKVGDRVWAAGNIDHDFFDKTELEAKQLAELK